MKSHTALLRTARWLGTLSLLSLLVSPSMTREVRASDHMDAPLTVSDAAADIGDFYAWHTERDTIVTILTFNPGLGAVGGGPPPTPYDPEVLYTIHIDNNATIAENNDFLDNDNDNLSNIDIEVRFGQNNHGDWGVQLLDVPGAAGPMVGPVQTVVTSGSAQAIAGVFDDPFFFDFDAFAATIMNLLDEADPVDIAFVPGMAIDTFAASNTLAIVVEFDTALALDGNPDDFLQLWASTRRLPR